MTITRDEHFDSMTTVCVDCRRSWSSKWPADGPSRRVNAEATLRGYGWKQVWGGWRCGDCRKARGKRSRARAPWVYAVGGVLVAVAVALVVVGVWL